MALHIKKFLLNRRAPILRASARILPENRLGDRVVALVSFLLYQRRFPRRRFFFNDYLHRLKFSGDLLQLPRQIASDKEYCKIFIDSIVGPGRTVPTIAVLRSPEAVDAYDFPSDCVIKATHLSGATIIRRNGQEIDRARIKGFFGMSWYSSRRESNYRYLIPKVIVESIVFDGRMAEFRMHSYKGKVRLISINAESTASGAETIERRDRDWNEIPTTLKRLRKPLKETEKPPCYEQLLEMSDMIAQNFEYIRVDAFVSGEDFVFGELTNIHMGGRSRFRKHAEEENFSRILFGQDFDTAP